MPAFCDAGDTACPTPLWEHMTFLFCYMNITKSRFFRVLIRISGDKVRAPGLALAAATVLAVEGAALVVFATIDLIGLGAGDAASLPTALALTALTIIGAVALIAFAWGVRRGRSWARSGGIVLQVLALALVLASLSLRPFPWLFVIAVGVPAACGLALLIASARAENERPAEHDARTDAEN
jgi:hypothetical protein